MCQYHFKDIQSNLRTWQRFILSVTNLLSNFSIAIPGQPRLGRCPLKFFVSAAARSLGGNSTPLVRILAYSTEVLYHLHQQCTLEQFDFQPCNSIPRLSWPHMYRGIIQCANSNPVLSDYRDRHHRDTLVHRPSALIEFTLFQDFQSTIPNHSQSTRSARLRQAHIQGTLFHSFSNALSQLGVLVFAASVSVAGEYSGNTMYIAGRDRNLSEL